MKKKWRWLIGGVAAAAMVVVVMMAAAGGAIMAQEDEGKQSRFSAFAERVASILGLEADDVEDAMEQAKQELADEALDEKLAALVEKGTITQEQADEYEIWIESKPDGLMFRGWPRRGSLDALVENGVITQEQADEYQEWIDSKPDFLESLERPGHHKFGDRDGGKRWKGWYGDKSGEDNDDDGDGA